jgi:uncharacterized protein GlcG (DUF336 family)
MVRKFVLCSLLILSLAGITFAQGKGNDKDNDNDNGNNKGSRSNSCANLPSFNDLRKALTTVRLMGKAVNGGLGLDMWGTIVDRDGVVCAVAFTGADRGSQWPGSRVISAQKANTANAFSLPGLSLSTANLFTATQPGGSLFGLQESNPVSTKAAYGGNSSNYGQPNDPMVGAKIGGVNVFGGGLALYNSSHQLLGAIGVSGDTSCADHNIAWRTRNLLGLDYVPSGISGDPNHKDNIIFDIVPQGNGDISPVNGQMSGVSSSGFGHASCYGYNVGGNATSTSFSIALPPNH